MQRYYAHGKLLLTGEYFILDGAVSLAVPTQRGQSLEVQSHDISRFLHWQSLDVNGKVWLEGTWDPAAGEWGYVNHPEKAKYLTALLEYANHILGLDLTGILATTKLEFPGEWGLGSSSSLISLLAQWWRTDPYTLLNISFGGSGYDVACAIAQGPILYQALPAPKTENVRWNTPFADQMYFVYLNQKQDSREGIVHYRNLVADKQTWVSEISDITHKLLRCEDFDELEYLLMLHEAIVSRVLNLEKVKDRVFPDFWGTVKSLGAWGGDCAWVVSDDSAQMTQAYFKEKGFEIFIPYQEMVFQGK